MALQPIDLSSIIARQMQQMGNNLAPQQMPSPALAVQPSAQMPTQVSAGNPFSGAPESSALAQTTPAQTSTAPTTVPAASLNPSPAPISAAAQPTASAVAAPAQAQANTNLALADQIGSDVSALAENNQNPLTTWGEGWTGWNDFLNRMSGSNLTEANTRDYQNNMGMASLLSHLGSQLLPQDSPFQRYASGLNQMQQGALMGSNQKQGEKALGDMQGASAKASSAQNPSAPVSPSGVSASSGGGGSGSSPAKSAVQNTLGYGRTVDPSLMRGLTSALQDMRFTV